LNGTLRLRRAGVTDAGAVSDLTRAAYAKWVPVIGREPLPMQADHARAVAEHVVILCEDGPVLMALIELIPAEEHLLIENLAVHPHAQGRGLGETLLRHAEDVARSLGLAEMRLYTNAAFTSNLGFYARRGYEEYRRDAMVPGSITVFMRKSVGKRG
jgi:GNAT superfamily N-acetyltransferase